MRSRRSSTCWPIGSRRSSWPHARPIRNLCARSSPVTRHSFSSTVTLRTSIHILSVRTDYSAGRIATEHLLDIGCKRIAHIQGPDNSTGKRRLKGFLDTLRKHNIATPPEYLVKAGSADVDGHQQGVDALLTLAALRRPPDGVFCFNDVIATGVILQASVQNIDVPRELAVIGCGNLHFDRLIRTPLSSVDQRSNDIGCRTGKLILELLAEDAIQRDAEDRFASQAGRPRLDPSCCEGSQAECIGSLIRTGGFHIDSVMQKICVATCTPRQEFLVFQTSRGRHPATTNRPATR